MIVTLIYGKVNGLVIYYKRQNIQKNDGEDKKK